MSAITTPTSSGGGMQAKAASALDELDQRYHPASGLRRQFNKVFPTHWSFLLGEIALYSFIVLLLSGIYLDAVLRPVDDRGHLRRGFENLHGVTMRHAYETTLDLSFEVRGGLFVRQIHHWAALIFMAAMVAHMFRIILHRRVPQAARGQLDHRSPPAVRRHLRGLLRLLAARRPAVRHRPADRVGDTLSVPGHRHLDALGAVRRGVPGDRDHPAPVHHPRAAAAGDPVGADRRAPGAGVVPEAHPVPRPGRTEDNVVGVRILPAFAAKGGAFFAVSVGVLGDGRAVPDQPDLELWGRTTPHRSRRGSQPDFYMGWSDGMPRIWPRGRSTSGTTRSPRCSSRPRPSSR